MKIGSKFALSFICLTASAIVIAQDDTAGMKIDDKSLTAKDESAHLSMKKRNAAAVAKGIRGIADLIKTVASLIPKGNVVTVVNRMNALMTVRCNSKQDQLGPRDLNNGDSMSFAFRGNIWGTTHFWCVAWGNGKNKGFPVYGEGAPKWNQIYYNMHNDGVYYTDTVNNEWGLRIIRW